MNVMCSLFISLNFNIFFTISLSISKHPTDLGMNPRSATYQMFDVKQVK